jgi:tryptophan synthase alpha chain
MSRIEQRFARLRERGNKGLIAYLTAGDPSLAATEELCLAFARAGVDIIEIGMPFSDPTADGPVIQAAAQRALKKGVTLEAVLSMIAGIRKKSEVPIVLFGYYNPLFIYGIEKFALRAREVEVDGILVVDLPYEESPELRRYTDACGIDFINLIAPTTDEERMRAIVQHAAGFLYLISITGITGTKKPDLTDIIRNVARVRPFTSLPIAVGFGITTPEQAAEIAPYADAVVVGSAFVKMIDENSGRRDMAARAARYASALKKALSGIP